jgi:Nucleotide-diphospho-sugar transferase
MIKNSFLLFLILVILCSVLIQIEHTETFEITKGGAVLMYCTPNLFDKWARHTLFLNRKYAETNGYEFVLISEPYDSAVTHAWQKIPAMIELLDKGHKFVMYIDTDAVFNKHNITIESIIEKYPGDILICSDESNSGGKYKTNGGAVIAKNTANARYLLNKWWELRTEYKEFAFEQWAISDIYEKKLPDIDSSMINVAPENEFNSTYGDALSFANNLDSSPPDIFVIHFMAMNDDMREAAFSKLVDIYKKNEHQEGFM